MASSGGKFKIRKTKWNSMRAANRIPEVALEQKLNDVRRFHAQFKRDMNVEEGKLWDYLFKEALILKSSLAKHDLQDILDGTVSLKRTWSSDNEEPLPYSEHFRRFIIFKASTMVKLFGRGLKSSIRPRYDDLYDKQVLHKDNNQRSYDKLVEKHLKRLAADERTLEALGADGGDYLDNDVDDLQSDLGEIETRRRSRAGTRVRGGHIQARPHHKRDSARTQASSGEQEDARRHADKGDAGPGDVTHTRREEPMERRRIALEALPPLVKPDRGITHNLPPLDEARTETELHLPDI